MKVRISQIVAIFIACVATVSVAQLYRRGRQDWRHPKQHRKRSVYCGKHGYVGEPCQTHWGSSGPRSGFCMPTACGDTLNPNRVCIECMPQQLTVEEKHAIARARGIRPGYGGVGGLPSSYYPVKRFVP